MQETLILFKVILGVSFIKDFPVPVPYLPKDFNV